MKNKILIAVDESKNAMKAVEHVANILGTGVQITLFHVLPKAPAKGIETEKILVGHHLVFKEGVVDFREWLKQKRAAIEQVMDKARTLLIKSGLESKNIQIKIQQWKKGVARDILSELRAGKYDTVVMGRRGLSGTKAFFAGSVSNKIIQHAKNCGVWVVE